MTFYAGRLVHYIPKRYNKQNSSSEYTYFISSQYDPNTLHYILMSICLENNIIGANRVAHG